MNIKDPICQSGGKKANTGRFINEDGLITFNIETTENKYDFIILMDGATGLGKDYEIAKGLTSAEWYVKFMMEEIKKILLNNPSMLLEEVVESCILKATNEITNYEKEHNLILEEYQKPSAGLALLRKDNNTTDIFLIGDVETIVAYKTGEVTRVNNPNQTALQKLDSSVLSRMVEIANQRNCNVIDTRSDLEIETMLQVNREKKNTNCEGSYCVCGTTPGTANHGICVSFDNNEIEGIILATDGFAYSMLNLNEKQVYDLIKKKGNDYVSKAIRDEQEADVKCNKFPRFKQGDDLTVVLADYS